jgi:hypothetical protein
MAKHVTHCTWEEVPHLPDGVKAELLDGIPPYQRAARSKGYPSLGAGAIYPLDEDDVVVADFELADHWPRAYGLDVGWNRTAAAWFARDEDTGVTYLYSEHYRGQAEPIIHVEAIKARGSWIPGVIDPAARSRSQKDGSQLLEDYQGMGLDLAPATNAVSAGILEVWQALSYGHLKVFASCNHWREEFRLYRRDEDGKVVKEDDHLMDATRYFYLSGRDLMTTRPSDAVEEELRWPYTRQQGGTGWMSN